MFLFKFPFGPLSTNAILLGCSRTKQCAIIDPSPGSANAILQKVQDLNLHVDKILLTHSHWDHFADVGPIREKTHAPVYVHPLDAKNLEQPGSDRIPQFLDVAPVHPDSFFQEGDTISVGDLKIKVIHTPGHSPGSVCFYLKEQNLLISGDTLFKQGYGNLSLPTAQPGLMGASLKKLAALPPKTRVVPGHGDDTMIEQETWLMDDL